MISLRLRTFWLHFLESGHGSISRSTKESWWQNVTLQSISWCGKSLMAVLRIRLKYSGRILWLSKQSIQMMDRELWMLCCLEGPFSLGRQIHRLGSTPYGWHPRILQVVKQAFIGMLGKHFETLIQCDPRLSFLSQQPEIVLECPYFESHVAGFEEPNEYGSDMKSEETSLGAVASPSGAQTSFSTNEQDFIARAPENYTEETPSPSSVTDANKIEEMRSIADKDSKFPSNLEQIKVPLLHPWMSMSDLASHIGHCISEQMENYRPIFSGNKRGRDILEEVTQILLSDTQSTLASDQQSLVCRVNSLCCLLQKDPSTSQNLEAKRDDNIDINSDQNIGEAFAASTHESNPAEGDGDSNDGSGCKQAPTMSRKDSFAELLLNLPRIASLPWFWFSLPEDSYNHSR